MPRLFSYTIPVDDGAAPNPFRGLCTLAICKPGIRRVAKEGDWVAGLGSAVAPSGNLSGRLVYAMRVEEVLTLKQYNADAPSRWPHRIPNVASADLTERLGDCIYDYSSGTVVQRRGVHIESNKETDLGGENVLISRDFYYFGNHAIALPRELHAIRHQTQGHRSESNDAYVDLFESWIRELSLSPGMHGWPDYLIKWHDEVPCDSCTARRRDGEHDPAC